MATTQLRRHRYSAAALALVLAACVDSPFTPTPSLDAQNATLAVVGKPPIDQTLEGEGWICKDGTGPAENFTFAVSVNGGAATNHVVALGTCVQVVTVPTNVFNLNTVSVTEAAPPANWALSSITIESNSPSSHNPTINPPNATARVSHDFGVVFTFTNTFTPPPTGGCTSTPGYWKNHAGNGKKQDVVTPLLPIWLGTAGGAFSVQVTTSAQAIFILDKENDPASDGLNKLRTHLLAAKLNIARGANGSVVATTIADADAFLATHGDWNALTAQEQAQVLAWKTALDNYNNGLTGPGHCS